VTQAFWSTLPGVFHVPRWKLTDYGLGIAVDRAGSAYVTGFTVSRTSRWRRRPRQAGRLGTPSSPSSIRLGRRRFHVPGRGNNDMAGVSRSISTGTIPSPGIPCLTTSRRRDCVAAREGGQLRRLRDEGGAVESLLSTIDTINKIEGGQVGLSSERQRILRLTAGRLFQIRRGAADRAPAETSPHRLSAANSRM